MDDDAEPIADSPVPLSLLADLQAGLLDDDTAAALRRRIRTDPEAASTVAALDRVRRDLADLGSDWTGPRALPQVPADITARLATTLAAATTSAAVTTAPAPATHAARVSASRPATMALVIGAVAAVGAVAIGVDALLDSEPRSLSTPATADRITVSRAPADPPVQAGFPLPAAEVLALLHGPAGRGALTDPDRLAACLTAAGLPDSATVVGAEAVDVDGRAVVVLVLAGERDDTMTALAITPTCSADNPRVVAETVLPRALPTP